jgi:hypothetical protein
MNAARRAERVRHMLMWSMLTLPSDANLSWRFLLEWAYLGGDDVRGMK